jgi:hypothetical protein
MPTELLPVNFYEAKTEPVSKFRAITFEEYSKKRIYSKLNEAILNMSDNDRIFAFESMEMAANRKFLLIEDVDLFWKMYSRMEKDERHFYEIINFGRECKLYFDIEFHYDLQTEDVLFLNEFQMMKDFINFVLNHIQRDFKQNIGIQDVLDL